MMIIIIAITILSTITTITNITVIIMIIMPAHGMRPSGCGWLPAASWRSLSRLGAVNSDMGRVNVGRA